MRNKLKISVADEYFFSKFQAGEDEGFSYFYKLYFGELCSYGVGLGFDKEIVKDLIQDIFYKIYFDRINISCPKHLKFYLLRALKNALNDYHKSHRFTSSPSDNTSHFVLTTTVLDDIIDGEDKTILQKQIDNILANLTDRQKEVLFLRYMQEMEYEEISKLMNLSVHATRKLVYRALSKAKDVGVSTSFFLLLFFSEMMGA